MLPRISVNNSFFKSCSKSSNSINSTTKQRIGKQKKIKLRQKRIYCCLCPLVRTQVTIQFSTPLSFRDYWNFVSNLLLQTTICRISKQTTYWGGNVAISRSQSNEFVVKFLIVQTLYFTNEIWEKKKTLNISEKKEIWACNYSFPVTSRQNTFIHFWYYRKNSSVDAVLVKYLVKSI